MSELIQLACRYAINAHGRIDHRRKYSGKPYDAHLKAVAEIVSTVTQDELCIAAAWLHDTVEDTPATFADLERAFGMELTQLVRELTDISKPSDGNRTVRKAIDREHLASASPQAKTVKLADLIDNCRDISQHDPRFAKTFLFEARALLPVLQAGDPGLLKRAEREFERCARRLGIGSVPVAYAPGDDYPQVPLLPTHERRVQRLFIETFSARDIAEPLRSFDVGADPEMVREALESHNLGVVGLREAGLVSGYLRLTDLDSDTPSPPYREFRAGQIVTADASLSEVILVLTRHEYCFVRLLESVDAVICREDIQKPIVRMWLFGMITMIEMHLSEYIRRRWPDGSWCQQLPRSRLQKAEALFEERARRQRSGELLDCLQLGDKLHLAVAEAENLQLLGFSSRAAAKKVAREFESLRNNLAHAQDIITHDWPQIARMTARIEASLSR